MAVRGAAPNAAELSAYADRLSAITKSGGRIKLVQIHTLARPPAESWVTPLPTEILEAIAAQVRARTGLEVAFFGG